MLKQKIFNWFILVSVMTTGLSSQLLSKEKPRNFFWGLIKIDNEDKDELYETAIEIIKSEGKASTSFLQRKLQIGYNRAARIIDMMEANGIVSKANHVGKREVL